MEYNKVYMYHYPYLYYYCPFGSELWLFSFRNTSQGIESYQMTRGPLGTLSWYLEVKRNPQNPGCS